MNSLVTIVEPLPEIKSHNEKLFWEMLYKYQPELYLLAMVLEETKIRPVLLVPIVKMLGNLNLGNGYGTVNIVMRNHVLTLIKGEESIVVNTKLVK